MLRRDPLANPEPLLRRVYAYVAYRIGDGADAEDVTAATFERALRYRETFDAARGEPAAWLVGIARRCIVEHHERRLPVECDVPDRADADDLAERAINRIDLARSLAGLEERECELLALRYGADLSAKQIAALLDMKTNAVEVALHRILNRLRTSAARDAGAAIESPARLAADVT
jgi:RNA polymerase sigma factor (sigma-70 family)